MDDGPVISSDRKPVYTASSQFPSEKRTRKKYLSSRLTIACLIAGGTASASTQTAMTHSNQKQTAAWQQLVSDYFDQVYLPFHPTAATSAGLHQYDSRLEDYSRSAID